MRLHLALLLPMVVSLKTCTAKPNGCLTFISSKGQHKSRRCVTMLTDPASAQMVTAIASDYVPSPLDSSVIFRQLGVMGLTGASFYFWWDVLVPARRTELAKEKRDKSEGGLGNYLDQLREADASAELQRQKINGATVKLCDSSQEGDETSAKLVGESKPRSRTFERWLLRDWLSEKSQEKAAALPFLPKAKFNSGDNPILVATGLIMITGVISSVFERF
jgi:hypothetical protein